jgi:YbbR domain-containing protein
MKKFFNALLNIKVLSVIFAIALWYYVIGIQGPSIDKTFTTVPVIPINVASDSFVVNSINTVSVTAEGPSKIILGLKDTDFSAIVDLTGKKFGDYYLPVEVHSPLSNISVKSTTPDNVKVTIEKVATLTLPVTCELMNVPNNFLPAVPVVSPATVNIVGPESSLSNIAKVYVTVDLSTITDKTTLNLPVKIETKDGSEPSNLYVNPSSCIVAISKAILNANITVPIIPTVAGVPLSGFGLKSVLVNPLTITISGDYSKISALQSISTAPIDISRFTQPTSIDVNIVIPDGTKSTISKCTVKIDIEPLKTVQIKVPLTILHDDTKSATSTTDSVELTITGIADIVNSINPQVITASVNATHLDIGTYTLPIAINNMPAGITVNFINPVSCEVIIS